MENVAPLMVDVARGVRPGGMRGSRVPSPPEQRPRQGRRRGRCKILQAGLRSSAPCPVAAAPRPRSLCAHAPPRAGPQSFLPKANHSASAPWHHSRGRSVPTPRPRITRLFFLYACCLLFFILQTSSTRKRDESKRSMNGTLSENRSDKWKCRVMNWCEWLDRLAIYCIRSSHYVGHAEVAQTLHVAPRSVWDEITEMLKNIYNYILAW